MICTPWWRKVATGLPPAGGESWSAMTVPAGFAAAWDPSTEFSVLKSTANHYRTNAAWASYIPAAIKTRYVDAAATGAADGTSWADAYTVVQDAIDEAVADSDVTRIYVRAGTYEGWVSGAVDHDLAIIADGGAVTFAPAAHGAAGDVGAGNTDTHYFEGITFDQCTATDAWPVRLLALAVFVDCAFENGTQNGLGIDKCNAARVLRCTATGNGDDGINYHDTTAIGGVTVLEESCTSTDNGAGITDNCSTVHESIAIVRVNCIYARTVGPIVNDIGTGVSWNVGCSATGCLGAARATTSASWKAQNTRATWLSGCTGSSNYCADVYDTNGGGFVLDPYCTIGTIFGDAVSFDPAVGLTGEAFLTAYFVANGGLWVEGDASGSTGGIVNASTRFERETQPTVGAWTVGAGWTDNGDGTFTHAAGDTAALSQANLLVTRYYAMTFAVTAVTAGTVTQSAGTTAGAARSTAASFVDTIECIATTTWAFTPSADFVGTIRPGTPVCIALKYLVPRVAAGTWYDSVGAVADIPYATTAGRQGWQVAGASGRNEIRTYNDVYVTDSGANTHSNFLIDGTGGMALWCGTIDDLSDTPDLHGNGGNTAAGLGYRLTVSAAGAITYAISNGTEYIINDATAAGVIVQGTRHVVINRFDGTTAEIWVDGTRVLQATASGAAAGGATVAWKFGAYSTAARRIRGVTACVAAAAVYPTDGDLGTIGAAIAARHNGTWT